MVYEEETDSEPEQVESQYVLEEESIEQKKKKKKNEDSNNNLRIKEKIKYLNI